MDGREKPDLFSINGNGADRSGSSGPLADRMRPRTLDDVIGQDHIVGGGRLLRRAIQADRLSSLIFYGPPGTGKTSLARVIANTTRSAFESLNAVLSGVKDIREAIDRADERRRLYGKRTILFVDEVHRWNKAQQDALLPWVENGTIILVGATTENPFFEVNRALVSRSRIFQLKSLDRESLMETARRTLADRERGYGNWRISFEEGALEHLVEVAGGDARSLLNAIELAVETSAWNNGEREAAAGGVTGGDPPLRGGAEDPKGPEPGGISQRAEGEASSGLPPSWPPPEGAFITVTMEAAEESIQKRAVLYDRDGDYHFDTISAFIKSVRGSDPDAALYWLAKMVRAGEDPAFILRRMIILASEDVGLADPYALEVVIACAQAFDRIGYPEGSFPLAHACLYLATAPKSNTTMAFFDALKEVDREDAEVPSHLKDPGRDAEGFGHGEGYIYPHAYRDHWAAQQYLPSALRGKTFYAPSAVGYENTIREAVLRKREIQAAIVLGAGAEHGGEILSWSQAAKGREGWFKRLESGRAASLLADRDDLFAALQPERHSRILIPAAHDGLLLWEALRRAPEGLAAGITATRAAQEALEHCAGAFALDETEQPKIAVLEELLPSPAQAEQLFQTPVFDRIALREPWRRGFRGGEPDAAFAHTAAGAFALLAPGGKIAVIASPPALGQRISALLAGDDGLIAALAAAEAEFFKAPEANAEKSPWNWTAEGLERAFCDAGFGVTMTALSRQEERAVTAGDAAAWFDREKSSWGAAMAAALGADNLAAVRQRLETALASGPLLWKWNALLLLGTKADCKQGSPLDSGCEKATT